MERQSSSVVRNTNTHQHSRQHQHQTSRQYQQHSSTSRGVQRNVSGQYSVSGNVSNCGPVQGHSNRRPTSRVVQTGVRMVCTGPIHSREKILGAYRQMGYEITSVGDNLYNVCHVGGQKPKILPGLRVVKEVPGCVIPGETIVKFTKIEGSNICLNDPEIKRYVTLNATPLAKEPFYDDISTGLNEPEIKGYVTLNATPLAKEQFYDDISGLNEPEIKQYVEINTPPVSKQYSFGSSTGLNEPEVKQYVEIKLPVKPPVIKKEEPKYDPDPVLKKKKEPEKPKCDPLPAPKKNSKGGKKNIPKCDPLPDSRKFFKRRPFFRGSKECETATVEVQLVSSQ